MSWGAVIVGGSAILGGAVSSQGAKSAANAQSKAGDAAIAEQRRQFDTLLSLTAPQRAIGNQALAALGDVYGYAPYDAGAPENRAVGTRSFKSSDIERFLRQGLSVDDILALGIYNPGAKASDTQRLMQRYGLSTADINQLQNGTFSPRAPVTIDGATGKALNSADYTNFFASPDYKFRFQQGEQAVQNSAAAGPAGLYSGNTLRALTDYGQGMGASEFGNWFARQAALAGLGQAATSQAGNAALTTGANVGNLLVNQGNARASGVIGETNSMTNIINQLSQLWGSGAFSRGGLNSGWGSGANLNNAWADQWGGTPPLVLEG